MSTERRSAEYVACRCPRCLVLGPRQPLTQEQAQRLVDVFMERIYQLHNDGTGCGQ